MKIWIDQDECTGSGEVEVLEPGVFALGADGQAVLRDGDSVLPSGPAGALTVSPKYEREVLEAGQACPGRRIRIESE